MQVREKVRKSSPKAGALNRWEIQNCTPLWLRSTFRSRKCRQNYKRRVRSHSWPDEMIQKSARRCGAKHISKSKCTKHTRFGPLLEVEMSKKVHAVVARSTFRSQNVQNTPGPDHFWKLRCRKSACRCGAKHISKSKCTKHHQLTRPLLEVEMSKKCTPLWREAHFEVKMCKTPHVHGALLDVQMSFRVAGTRDCASCQKWAKREGFVAFPKTMAGVGHLKRICKDAFRAAGAVQKTCSSEMLGGQGADFLRGVAFWSIRSAGLLRWFCVTGAALRMTWHQFFVAGAVL